MKWIFYIPDDIKFLLFTKNHEIRGVDLIKAHFNVIPVITIPHVDNPTAIDYDINSNTLYWADKGLSVINKANISADAEVETIIDNGKTLEILQDADFFLCYSNYFHHLVCV